MKKALFALALLLTPVTLQADVCSDIFDALGIEPDTTIIECPLHDVVIFWIIRDMADSLVVTPEGDTLSWPPDTGSLPPAEENVIPTYVFGMKPGDYAAFRPDYPLPYHLGTTTEVGSVSYSSPLGPTELRRIE